VQCRAGLEALVFDCDGVILESEDLHRRAYNAAFEEFGVRCNAQSEEPLVWTPEFYDELQNQIGGGKPKMRW
jgi:beta-phosphoglucomutase-like phosphatase (HAD superfamily)